MVQAPHHRCQPAQAVKAPPALARVDRLPQRPGFQEIRLLEVARARQTPHTRQTIVGARCDFPRAH